MHRHECNTHNFLSLLLKSVKVRQFHRFTFPPSPPRIHPSRAFTPSPPLAGSFLPSTTPHGRPPQADHIDPLSSRRRHRLPQAPPSRASLLPTAAAFAQPASAASASTDSAWTRPSSTLASPYGSASSSSASGEGRDPDPGRRSTAARPAAMNPTRASHASFCDRTNAFCSAVKSAHRHASLPPPPSPRRAAAAGAAAPGPLMARSRPTLASSEFNNRASKIRLRIHQTSQKLARLAKCMLRLLPSPSRTS
jgi:hypothetical protein